MALSRTLSAIRQEDPKARPWDILAWRAAEVAFVECKGPGERFTKAEEAFLFAAIRANVPVDAFAVLRAKIDYPG